ncbi:hypothetical protein D3C71_2060800 [compost metagenome]
MIQRLDADRVQRAANVQDNHVIVIARQVDQGIDVAGADLHRLHRIFRRRQNAQIGQHAQQAGGEERGIHAHDLA